MKPGLKDSKNLNSLLFNTPILFLIFNRPESTFQVFEKIKKIKPAKLFIAADGPRDFNEEEKCNEVRKVIEKIDWDCEVQTLFREKNLGCKLAVSSAIIWFFSIVKEGIILEDDCLPNEDFFYYCEELLDKYRDDTRIMHIGGANCIKVNLYSKEFSYRFSAFPEIWGWATWRRAWNKYDIEMKDYPKFKKDKIINNIFKNKIPQLWWIYLLNKTYRRKINTWDFQWCYSIFKENGITIMPNKNLIKNIGFGLDSTNTFSDDNSFANIPLQKILPLKHPDIISINYKVDDIYSKQNCYDAFIGYIKRFIKNRKK